MTTERWTDERLDKLANTVEQLIGQFNFDQLGQQISDQISASINQLGSRVEQTCDRVDALVASKREQSDQNQGVSARSSNLATDPSASSNHLLDRLASLEAQMQQLIQRVQYLERREAVRVTQQPLIAVGELHEEDVEDEPDEILWDFFDPTEQQKSQP